ncbi:MAG: hypothetical protein A3D74_00990 [Candidatus Levybacteria bacterium RIFCSPHIGHO2_02_FULL_37_13]|nr:MAG: hypothetical protein A3D74_00990 [Candidatus Levybacteria bacterium RIFCSPHIGHO2_02_FULL_37_13]OGH29365.1 MAG: hypothetical protein A3E40_00770 [Candidatus Levybacteria bacterium RIFCSPHIGHO2_12_FULL_37_9]OGH39366.1 MAG: hypothetical protein A3B41_03110 [Candidatus Levybacteria bacterium RIFCSPLOWO2_01_FULL_37_26]
MKFGIRVPSLKRRIAARTSWKRMLRHSMGLKAPRGMEILTNPKRALYNKIYHKTTIEIDDLLKGSKQPTKPASQFDGRRMTITTNPDGSMTCPRCEANMGQPMTKGLFIKKQVYICPNCKLEAKVTNKTG